MSASLDYIEKSQLKPTVIVIGAGPVGIKVVEELNNLLPNSVITLFSGEPFNLYDRVKLSQLLARDIDESQIYQSLPEGDNVQLFDNCPVVEIDRRQKKVKDVIGNWHNFDKLVLALGSVPFLPSIPNIEIKNVFTFRNMKDTEALFARNISSRHTVVVGGGLLGLETARAMFRNKTKVSVIQMASHLMERQLDYGAGKLLEDKVKKLGIDVICSSRVKAIVADENDLNTNRAKVSGVILHDGTQLECDTVVISAGIKPRIKLALESSLHVDKGIVVNNHLQTNDEDIYAVGECAQFGSQTFGLVAPGFEHASVVAHHISGAEANYQGSINSTTLKVLGEQVFSVGEVNTEMSKSIQSNVYISTDEGIYRSIFTINDRLVGALAIGGYPEQNRIRVSITEGRKINIWNRLLFKFYGVLWQNQTVEDINSWPSAMVVCNCTGVTQSQLCQAKSSGITTLEALAAETKASTVCGSCKPLLSHFVGESNIPVRGKDIPWLQRVSLSSLIILIIYLIVGPLNFSTSVQQIQLDQLWLDSFTKQVTGFTLLALASVSLLISLSKRWGRFNFGKFTSWRIIHTVLGVISVLTLLGHTGLRLGINLNQWLMIDFILIVLLGGFAGLIISHESLVPAKQAKLIRSYFTWGHTIVFWPLPILLTFHIISVYYF